jgi:hypothetical protein
MKKSETNRIIEREEKRLAPSTGIPFLLTRRALLTRVAAVAAAWTISPWRIGVLSAFGQEPSASGQGMDHPATTQTPGTDTLTPEAMQTLEAFADTLIPGEKRFPADRAIAGVVSGAGAVQGGAIKMMEFVGLQPPALNLLALTINLRAVLYAFINQITLDSTVPPFVALDFASRTALLFQALDPSDRDQPALSALAALSFVAFNTAGYLPTVDAIQQGHPGLAAIGFPPPNPDGLWRFPVLSYQQVLAKPHPKSKNGNPA